MRAVLMLRERWMSFTADELSAFHGTVRHGGLRKAVQITGTDAKQLIESRRRLAEVLDKKLFTGNGKAQRLTAEGHALYAWIDTYPGGAEPAALELSKHGWDAVEPGGAAPDPYDDPDAPGEPTIAQTPALSTIEPSRLKVRVELPQHPVLAELVRSTIASLPAVAGTFQIAKGGPWPSAI